MVCEMEMDQIEDMDVDVLPSMWPEDAGSDIGKQFNVEKPRGDQDMLNDVTIKRGKSMVDYQRLLELTDYTDQGSLQLGYLIKQWEYRQANAVRLLREELDNLSRQKEEAEIKELKILEEHRFEDETCGNKRPISILDDVYDIWPDVPPRKDDGVVHSKMRVEIDAEYDTVLYWKQRALHLEKLLEASMKREQVLAEKLEECIKNFESQVTPVEELSQVLKRADSFLHFVLQNAPVVIGHQDKDLRYKFIYNKFPSLQEQDILGKTDVEIFSGAGVKESEDFKREVLQKGKASKREITFDTELFGWKTFLIYVEPVFNKAGEIIGINYMGMEVTDQVRKREKMAKLREEGAVRKAMESELNKTIHITEETMRAKQMLATMSHEIRSPLSGVVSMAEILSNTKLDREQRQLLKVMISSGDLVLQLINDILDLSKVESGVMKLEATRFRPREVVKHVLQTAAASLKKVLTLEGHVADDVPREVVGDVLRIRQILTNLISNAIKFTHKGKVGIKLYVVPEPSFAGEGPAKSTSEQKGHHSPKLLEGPYQSQLLNDKPGMPAKNINGNTDEKPDGRETTVWIQCDVHDTGIGIPENALPSLFKKYMQASADHARKYGGTGLGLAICKQLVELMGGRLTVTSRVNHGSTFTFILPYRVALESDNTENSDDSEEMSDTSDHDDANDDMTTGFFLFQPRAPCSLLPSDGSVESPKILPGKMNGLPDVSYSFPSNNVRLKKTASDGDCCSAVEVAETYSEHHESASSHGPMFDNHIINGRARHCQRRDIQSQNHYTESTSSSGKSITGRMVDRANEPAGSFHWQEIPDASSQCISSGSPELAISSGSPELAEPKFKPKILLAEDNKINVMVTQSMMKQLGHSIEVVHNGIEAIHAIQHSSYDLVLMDVCMPVMDGLQATRVIRSYEETGKWDAAIEAGVELAILSTDSRQDVQDSRCQKRMPIIAMTANTLAESSEECYANGMDSFISKPVTFQKLKRCLEQYLRQ